MTGRPTPTGGDRFAVALVTNDRYAAHSGVTIASVVRQASCPARLAFHVVSAAGALSRLNRERIAQCAGEPDRVTFHDVDPACFDGVPVSGHYRAENYFRFLLPAILVDCSRCLYLDSDIVVGRDILELAGCLRDGYAAAAVRDYVLESVSDSKGNALTRLGLQHYFNSGVMLLDLDVWRARGLGDACLRFAKEHAGTLPCVDQDVLNVLLRDDVQFLPPWWNVISGYDWLAACRPGCLPQGLKPVYAAAPDRVRKVIASEAIVLHYAGAKPWAAGFPPSLNQDVYWRYERGTPWWSDGRRGQVAMRRARQRAGGVLLGLAATAWYLLLRASGLCVPRSRERTLRLAEAFGGDVSHGC